MQSFFQVMRRWFAGGTAAPPPPPGARKTPWHVRVITRRNTDGQPASSGVFQFHSLHARPGGTFRFRNLHGHATGKQES